MQTVTAGWKTNQEQNLRSESFVELSFRVIDATSQADATATADASETYSGLASITDGTDKTAFKYATCEGVWVLDGTCSILPDSAPYGSIGFVSDVESDANGEFTSNPTVTLSFTGVQSQAILGLTIEFATAYNEWAKDYIIKAYNGATVVAQLEVSGNDSVTDAPEVEIDEYDSITIEITKWSEPYHRARIDDILMGVVKILDKTDIISYSHTMECDPISTGLPRNEIEFTLNNTNGMFNPFNPVGMAQYLAELQEITVRYGYTISGATEWINGGTFWLSEWQTPTNGIVAKFKAKNLLDFMSAKYTGTLNDTFYNIATAALTQAALPETSVGGDRWSLSSILNGYSANITDDYDYTIAETLQMIANAACCVIYQDRDGILHIERMSPSLTDYPINKFNSYKYGEYEILKPLKSVTVNDTLYATTPAASGEVENIDNPFIQIESTATEVGDWVADWLNKRRSIKGEYRADPRLDTLDGILSETKYSLTPLLITSLAYNYNGAFKGKYTGRIYTNILSGISFYLGGEYLGGGVYL